jgi:hypothetical protein
MAPYKKEPHRKGLEGVPNERRKSQMTSQERNKANLSNNSTAMGLAVYWEGG